MADSLFDQEDEIDYLQELTKPGGKYDRTKYSDDSELLKALAKGKYHGDKTLDLKLTQFDELREELDKREDLAKTQAKLDELLTKIEKSQSGDNNQSTPEPMDLNQLDAAIETKFQAIETRKKEAANMEEVENRLRARFGDNAASILKDKMNTLSLTRDDLKFLAKRSPEAVLNTLGLNSEQTDTYQAPPRSNVRTDSFKPTVEIRDAVYYEKMRREQPKEYFSEKISVQRLKDMDHPDFMKRYQERQQKPY